MCDPLSAGLALGANVGGSLLNAKEASDNQAAMINARNQATQEELARDKAYGEKSRGIFDTSLAGYNADPTKAQTDSVAAIQSNAPTNVGSITSTNAPKVVADREGAKLADVFTRNSNLNTALGNLKGYSNNMVNNQLGLNQSGRDIDMIGDFAKTSAGVNAVEQRAAANNAYKPPSGIGQILQTAGQLGAFYGGKGGGSIFGGGTPAPMGGAFNPTQMGSLY